MQKESFSSHPVFEKFQQLEQILTNDESRKQMDLENLNFFDTFYKYGKGRLNLTIPVLVQESELNNLLNEIDSGNVQLNTYLGNKNIGHLTNATNNFISALNRIKSFPFLISKGDFNFSDTISIFQNVVEEKYDEIKSKNESLEKELSELQDELNDKKTQLQNLEKKVADKETEILAVLTKYNTEFDTLKTNANTSVETDRTTFAAKIEADRKEFTDSFEDDKKTYKTEFISLVKKINDDASATMSSLDKKLEEAKSIVNIVGNMGVTGNYQNIANQNKKSANFWRVIAVVFMVIMTGLIVWSIIDLSSHEFNLYKSIVRIIAAAVLTYPAIYAARESSKHRNLETKNRNLELELASIGPFIELLPEANRQKIKEELVKKYFGNTNGIEVDNKLDEEVSIGAFEKILKALLPLLKKT